MKKILLILATVLLWGCSSDNQNTSDCNCDVKTYVKVLETNDVYFNGQQYDYESNDCDNDGLIVERFTDTDGNLNFEVTKVVECKTIE